jgi:hypothetical protein
VGDGTEKERIVVALIAIATFIVLVLGQAQVDPFDGLLGPGYSMVATHGAYGIIIDARYAARFIESSEDEATETWTPTREDIVAAEELLQPYRSSDAVDAERRQQADSPDDLVSRTWYGGIVDGERILYVDGYCTGGLPEQPLLPMFVADGGACFWNATINADTWEIVGYSENGEA